MLLFINHLKRRTDLGRDVKRVQDKRAQLASTSIMNKVDSPVTPAGDTSIFSPFQFSLHRGNQSHIPDARCGSTSRRMGTKKEPPSENLRCGQCDSKALRLTAERFIKWIGKTELAKLNQGGQL
jgi:hypothetical protein